MFEVGQKVECVAPTGRSFWTLEIVATYTIAQVHEREVFGLIWTFVELVEIPGQTFPHRWFNPLSTIEAAIDLSRKCRICDRPHNGLGLCKFHYDRQRMGRNLYAPKAKCPGRSRLVFCWKCKTPLLRIASAMPIANGLCKRCGRIGKPKDNLRLFSNEDIQAIRNRYKNGESSRAIAATYGCHKYTIWRVATGRLSYGDCRDVCGKQRIYHGPVGEMKKNAKLTEDDVRLIRSMHSPTMGYKRLSVKFGVGETTIRRIVNRKKWCHI